MPEPTSPCNPMARSAVQHSTPSMRKSGDPNGMAACVSCMLHASAIVAAVRSGSAVWAMGPRRRNHGVSAPSYTPLLSPLHRLVRLQPLPSLRRIPSCGETGVAVRPDANGSASCVHKPSRSRALRRPRFPVLSPSVRSPEPNGPIGACRGQSGWLAMPLPR